MQFAAQTTRISQAAVAAVGIFTARQNLECVYVYQVHAFVACLQ